MVSSVGCTSTVSRLIHLIVAQPSPVAAREFFLACCRRQRWPSRRGQALRILVASLNERRVAQATRDSMAMVVLLAGPLISALPHTPRRWEIVSILGNPTAPSYCGTPPKAPQTASGPVAGVSSCLSARSPARQILYHSFIVRRLRSNRSVRQYVASTLFFTTCASAVSTTSRRWSVSFAARSRNDDRKPCTVEGSATLVSIL